MPQPSPLQPTVDPWCEDHDPALYRPAATATGIASLAEIGAAEERFYDDHGYLVVNEALSAAEVAETIAAIERLSAQGWRGTMYEAAVGRHSATGSSREPTPEQQRQAIRKLAFMGEDARECGLLVDHPGLVGAVQTLMRGRTPSLFQTMMLLKPPRIGREKPWHQDHAYFDLDMSDRVVGVWIALDEATVENGCMQILDRGHTLGPIPHWQRRDWQICDTEIMGKTSVAVPLKPGGALFFDSLLPHGTPKNHSPLGRRAMQLHYAPADGKQVTTEQRIAVFGTEGRNVTC